MSYILIPGDVYIRQPRLVKAKEPKSTLKKISRNLLTSTHRLLRKITSGKQQRSSNTGNAIIMTTVRIALHFLATCRQIRDEGSPIFYGMNTFHLPHGPVLNTIHWLLSLPPDHGKHIRTVLIRFDERDITTTALEMFDQWRQRNAAPQFYQTYTIHLPLFTEPELARFLRTKLWKEKWILLRRWSTLEAIHLDCGEVPHDRDTSLFGDGIRVVESMRILEVIADMAEFTAVRVGSRMRAHGWRATRVWLLELEQRK